MKKAGGGGTGRVCQGTGNPDRPLAYTERSRSIPHCSEVEAVASGLNTRRTFVEMFQGPTLAHIKSQIQLTQDAERADPISVSLVKDRREFHALVVFAYRDLETDEE